MAIADDLAPEDFPRWRREKSLDIANDMRKYYIPGG
jgi:hypothetical protein